MRLLSCFVGVFVLAALAAAGCSKGPTVYRVKGVVKYQGKPLTTGVVAFHHTDQKSPLVKGDIGADGTFQLTTVRPNDGAAPGEYRVTVTSMKPGKGVEGVDKDYTPPKALIPLKYMRLDESPLKATVEPRDDNDIQLSLTP